MELNLNTSAQNVRILVAGAGLFAAYICYVTLTDQLAKLRYEPVYGENTYVEDAGTDFSAVEDLPIVFAQGQDLTNTVSLSDSAIEAAFRKPVIAAAPVIIEADNAAGAEGEQADQEEAAQEPAALVLTPVQKFLLHHKPLVSGLANNGAVIGGTFWRIGERMEAFPIAQEDGAVLYPRLVSIGSKSVRVAVAGDSVSLDFKAY